MCSYFDECVFKDSLDQILIFDSSLNNSTIGANSMLRINAQTTSTDYRVGIVSVSNGRATIEITNKSAGSLSQAFVIAFEVIDIAST